MEGRGEKDFDLAHAAAQTASYTRSHAEAIVHSSLRASQSDGDLFVIVASDGVWEFISSQARLIAAMYRERGMLERRVSVHLVAER
eukprot:807109-Pleurochrysis_carterae.AAC.2